MSNTLIDLARGWPSQSLLPVDVLTQVTSRVLATPELYTPALLYGPDPGYQPLREAIAEWLAESSLPASWVQAENICITGGASQNLASLLQVFTDLSTTRNVYMVAPTYHLACQIFEDHGFAGRLKAVPQDEEGLDITYLESCLLRDSLQKVNNNIEKTSPLRKRFQHIIYCVPTFSNPCGQVMSVARRCELVRLARRYDALIIADDVYDLLSWTQEPLPPKLIDIDQKLDGGPTSAWGNVASNNSFSKILGPGVRTGWAVGARRLIQDLSQCGSTVSGGAPSQFMAVVIAEALKAGTLQQHLNDRLIPALRERCCVALDAIERFLMPHGFTVEVEVKGGYFVFLRLPQSSQITNISEVIGKECPSILVKEGSHFEVTGDEATVRSQDGMRICFAWEDNHRIVEGIRRLGELFTAATSRLEKCTTQ